MRAASLVESLSRMNHTAADTHIEETGTVLEGSERLLYVLTKPLQETRRTGLVICHSFLELSMLQRTELGLLRAAASAGFAGVYLQAPGAGDSEGDELDLTLEKRVAAAHASARFLSGSVGEIESIVFVGARMGAAVALLTASENELTAGVAVWDPVLDSEKYWKQARRLARIIAVMGRQKGFEDPDKELETRGWASMFGSVIDGRLKNDLTGISKASDVPLSAPVFLLSLNEKMVHESADQLPADAQVETHNLSRSDVGHLGLREAPEAIAPTVAWLERMFV